MVISNSLGNFMFSLSCHKILLKLTHAFTRPRPADRHGLDPREVANYQRPRYVRKGKVEGGEGGVSAFKVRSQQQLNIVHPLKQQPPPTTFVWHFLECTLSMWDCHYLPLTWCHVSESGWPSAMPSSTFGATGQ